MILLVYYPNIFLSLFGLLVYVYMLSEFQWDNLVPNIHYTLLAYRNDLHTKTPNIFACARIDIPEPTQRAIWLGGVHLTGSLVDVWELAA